MTEAMCLTPEARAAIEAHRPHPIDVDVKQAQPSPVPIYDPELHYMRRLMEVLDKMPEDMAGRLLRYLLDRYGE